MIQGCILFIRFIDQAPDPTTQSSDLFSCLSAVHTEQYCSVDSLVNIQHWTLHHHLTSSTNTGYDTTLSLTCSTITALTLTLTCSTPRWPRAPSWRGPRCRPPAGSRCSGAAPGGSWSSAQPSEPGREHIVLSKFTILFLFTFSHRRKESLDWWTTRQVS